MLLIFLMLLFSTSYSYILRRNNVCKTFADYYHPDASENCYYDPDTTLETPELIRKYARTVEIHQVTSEDGYIVTLFRIPRPNPKGVILLHHSIATDSHIYLWQGNESLALTLWHDGYDVWLANHRGTSYSDKHVNMTVWDYRYWDFSFHEIGLYDVDAEIQLIRAKTNNSQIIFMGHSLGAAAGLVYSTLKPEDAKSYIKVMILQAAPCYLDHIARMFQGLEQVIKAFVDSLQMGSPLLMLPLLLHISRMVLRLFPILLFLTSFFVWALCGYTPEETDPAFFNYDSVIYLNNFSWKTLLHFLQIVNVEHRFQMYNYGEEENLRIYGTEIPPVYPINKIKVPILLISSVNDTLITLKDSETLYNDLPQEAKVYEHWKISGLNHLDYHLGKHRKELFVDKLMTFLNNI